MVAIKMYGIVTGYCSIGCHKHKPVAVTENCSLKST